MFPFPHLRETWQQPEGRASPVLGPLLSNVPTGSLAMRRWDMYGPKGHVRRGGEVRVPPVRVPRTLLSAVFANCKPDRLQAHRTRFPACHHQEGPARGGICSCFPVGLNAQCWLLGVASNLSDLPDFSEHSMTGRGGGFIYRVDASRGPRGKGARSCQRLLPGI